MTARMARTLALGIALALVALLGLAGTAAASPSQVPCVPGVYSCPDKGTPPTVTKQPPLADEAPDRGAIARTGTTVTALLLVALVLLVLGRVLVHLGRRRRSARSVRARVRASGVDRPVPGGWVPLR